MGRHIIGFGCMAFLASCAGTIGDSDAVELPAVEDPAVEPMTVSEVPAASEPEAPVQSKAPSLEPIPAAVDDLEAEIPVSGDTLPPEGDWNNLGTGPEDQSELPIALAELASQNEAGNVCAARCDDLPVQSTPFLNRFAIQNCLGTCGYARLRPGEVYNVARGVTVPSGAILTTRGAGPTTPWAELRAVAETTSTIDPTHFGGNRIVTLCSRVPTMAGCEAGTANTGATLRFVRLNMNNKNKPLLDNSPNAPGAVSVSSVLHMTGNNNLAEYVDLYNPLTQVTIPSCGTTWGPKHRISGTSLSGPSTGNILRHSKIHGLAHGVVFNKTLKRSMVNIVDDVEIYMNRANALTFAGYGEVRNSHFHDNGWCVGDPYNGGAIYCAKNHEGGIVDKSELHDTCRDVIDWDNCWNMRLTNNHIYNPGTRVYPAPVGNQGPKCNSSQTVRMGVPHGALISGNNIQNAGRPWNTVGNHFARDPRFAARGAPLHSDLPDGAATSMAFLLVRRPDQVNLTTEGNDIRDNTFTATCNTPGVCVGLGYFTTRGTGLNASGGWSGATTNSFRRNRYTGSPKGSRRCGANWYAGGAWAFGGSLCQAGSTERDCNSDDANHENGDHGASHSAYRNCGCRSY